ncbi:LOW QUALITY PROTEIN: hypothetical protein PHPALM_27832 [Phytophthora palmivora]|uniref:MULE transposase domain-containing protein n=1 Tax=Phytophthora palmivora TaxID=4796 RepID=A0A2P4XBM2_9STRA|nr:LOW QUALITY PROTEIN: hypothetical protein PHPALM_27832 [Phytophthora palmivora]
MAITRMDLTAERIRKHIRSKFYPEKLALYRFGLTREQVIQRVHRTRRSHFGADLHGIVEVPPLSLVPGTGQPFFQFYRSYMNGIKLKRLIGWAHPALIKLLKCKKTTLFLEGIFRCVPHPFYQCVVMMVFDNVTDLFVPVFYILCSAKTQDTYWHLMEAVNVAADDKIQSSMEVCDFEAGLQEAVQVQFPEADVVGCFFHFKQACRRKLKVLGAPDLEVTIAMSKCYLDMLTVIPHDKFEGPGINYVQGKIKDACNDNCISYSDVLWGRFWQLKTYKPSVWNVFELNAGTRFNREITAALTAPHASLLSFVRMIQELSMRYVDRIDDTVKYRSKKRRRQTSKPTNLPLPIVFGKNTTQPLPIGS